MRSITVLAVIMVGLFVLATPSVAQAKRKAKAGTDSPKLNTKPEDYSVKYVKPIGQTRRHDVLPNDGEQDVIAVTPTHAARLLDYYDRAHALYFSVLEIASGKLELVAVELDKNFAMPFLARPFMARHGGENVVVFGQTKDNTLQVVFANWKTRKSVAVPCPDTKTTFDNNFEFAKYPICVATGGQHAMFVDSEVRRRWGDPKQADFEVKAWVASMRGIIPLKWKGVEYGLTGYLPECFAVTTKEICVLSMRQPADAATSGVEFFVLSFDARTGAFKAAEQIPGRFQADYPYLAPNGDYVWLKPWGKYASIVYARGTWKESFSSDFHDACIGFSHDGAAGVFLSNIDDKSSATRAQLSGVALKDGKVLWTTTISQKEAEGRNWEHKLKSVSAGTAMVAASFGIIKGESVPEAKLVYTKKEVLPFKPHGACYDKAGKQIAVLADDAIVIYDGKSKAETRRIEFKDGPKKAGACAILQFDKSGAKIMACVLEQWTRVYEVSSGKMLQEMTTPKGQRFRPLPDLSGVVYTPLREGAADLMLQTFADGAPKVLYAAQFEEGKATCMYVDDKGSQFLVMEKGAGEGNLALIDKNGKTLETYALARYSPFSVDGMVNAALMAPNKSVLLVGAGPYHAWAETGKREDTISGGASFADPPNLKAVSAEYMQLGGLLGIYFSQPLSGDAALNFWACPHGVITHNSAQNAIRFLVWNDRPEGWVAVHPRGEEFIVVTPSGIDIYSMK